MKIPALSIELGQRERKKNGFQLKNPFFSSHVWCASFFSSVAYSIQAYGNLILSNWRKYSIHVLYTHIYIHFYLLPNQHDQLFNMFDIQNGIMTWSFLRLFFRRRLLLLNNNGANKWMNWHRCWYSIAHKRK